MTVFHLLKLGMNQYVSEYPISVMKGWGNLLLDKLDEIDTSSNNLENNNTRERINSCESKDTLFEIIKELTYRFFEYGKNKEETLSISFGLFKKALVEYDGSEDEYDTL